MLTPTLWRGRPLEQVEDAPAREDEDALVERARLGDAVAFAGLVERYQDLAFRIAYVVAGNATEAEDAAQEAFIKAYYALPRFRAGAAFRPWLLQIVANQARNQRRAGGRRGGLLLRASAEERASGDAAPSPEVDALLQEQRQTLLAAVNGLRDEDRQVVAYRYFLELSEADMAGALGCARGTVKSRLSRALARLRQVVTVAGLVDDDRQQLGRDHDRKEAGHG
jgi:RNA polymerase sigma-70 factor (ECF subfamily)